MEVDLHDPKKRNLIALSFLDKNKDKVYLVPSPSTIPPKIRTEKVEDPQYFFKSTLKGKTVIPVEVRPAE